MIKPGDFLMFKEKFMAEAYGHNRPVEVIQVVKNGIMDYYSRNEDMILVKVWEPFLYVGQKEHQIEMEFHKSHFKLAGPWLGGDDGIQR